MGSQCSWCIVEVINVISGTKIGVVSSMRAYAGYWIVVEKRYDEGLSEMIPNLFGVTMKIESCSFTNFRHAT